MFSALVILSATARIHLLLGDIWIFLACISCGSVFIVLVCQKLIVLHSMVCYCADYMHCEETYHDWRTKTTTIYSSSSCVLCTEGNFLSLPDCHILCLCIFRKSEYWIFNCAKYRILLQELEQE